MADGESCEMEFVESSEQTEFSESVEEHPTDPDSEHISDLIGNDLEGEPEGSAGDRLEISVNGKDDETIEEALEPVEVEMEQVDEVEIDDDDELQQTPNFPLARVKKIMKICMSVEDDELNEEDNDVSSKSKSKSKGKGGMIITKEAIQMTDEATAQFIQLVIDMAARITVSSKKKTLTLEHLKRAVSESEAFDFLQGCFQPSIIIGD